MRIFLTAFYVLLIPLLYSCCKSKENVPEYKTPRETQTGRNTVYCKINGVQYIPEVISGVSFYPKIDILHQPGDSNGLEMLLTYPNGNKSKIIVITGYGVTGPGVYPIGSSEVFHAYYINKEFPCFYGDAFIYNSWSGEINLKRYDPSKKIFSGTFHFKNWLPGTSCDTITVTDGIFDVNTI